MLKAFFVSTALFFIPGCDGGIPFSTAERVPPKSVPLSSPSQPQSDLDQLQSDLKQALKRQFPDAKLQGVLYERQQLRQLELIYPRPITEPEILRLQIQSFLIDELTQKDHPEGSCVQVEHVLRAEKSVFKVLVVCVN